MQHQPAVQLTATGLSVHHPRLFSQGNHKTLREFTHRAFAHQGTHSVTLDPEQGRAEIQFEGDRSVEDHAPSLAELFSDATPSVPAHQDLPHWPSRGSIRLTRWRGVVTTLTLKELRSGWVSVNLKGRERVSCPINHFPERLRGLPGIVSVRPSVLRSAIRVRIDASAHPLVWIRTLEDLLGSQVKTTAPKVSAPRLPLATAHLNLVLCAAGQFMIPAALPVASGVLMASRYPHFKETVRELRGGRLGAPAFGTVVLACSVAAAAPFASALAEWLSCFWQRAWRRDIALQTRDLLKELEQGEGLEGQPEAVADPTEPASWTLTVAPGDVLPVDVRMLSGGILVQDTLRDSGPFRAIRKSRGDIIEGGYRVVAGEALVEPLNHDQWSRLDYVTNVVMTLPERITGDQRLKMESRRLADMSVVPNLAIAGAAMATGGLHMASAVLHQDWINAPFIATPTEFFEDLRAALRAGALVKRPAALLALAECQLLILDPRIPFLNQEGLEIVSIETHLANPAEVLNLAAAAAAFLGDPRTDAFRAAAVEANLTVTSATLLDFGSEAITARVGDQTVILRNQRGRHQSRYPDLEVVVDGQKPFFIRFGRAPGSTARSRLESLRREGLRPVLYGNNDQETLALSEHLGVEVIAPSMEGETLGHFIRTLQAAGYGCALLTTPEGEQPLTALAHVVLTAGGPRADHPDSQILLLDESLEALPALLDLGRSHAGQVVKATSKTIPANLLCIAGAFTGALNGTTSTLLAHSGVMAVTASQRRLLARGRSERKAAAAPSP